MCSLRLLLALSFTFSSFCFVITCMTIPHYSTLHNRIISPYIIVSHHLTSSYYITLHHCITAPYIIVSQHLTSSYHITLHHRITHLTSSYHGTLHHRITSPYIIVSRHLTSSYHITLHHHYFHTSLTIVCNTSVMLVLKCVSVSMGGACSLQCVWGACSLQCVWGACSLQCVWSACSLQCVWSACSLQCVWSACSLQCVWSACSLQFGIVHIGLAGHTSIEPLQLATQLQTEIRLNNSLGWSLTPSLQKASNGRSIGTATHCQGRSQCYGAHHLEFVPPGSDSNFSTRGQKSRWDTPSPSSEDPKMSSQQQHSVLEEVEEEEEEKGEEANRIMQGKEVFKKFKKKKGKNNRYTGLALRLGLVCGLR